MIGILVRGLAEQLMIRAGDCCPICRLPASFSSPTTVVVEDTVLHGDLGEPDRLHCYHRGCCPEWVLKAVGEEPS